MHLFLFFSLGQKGSVLKPQAACFLQLPGSEADALGSDCVRILSLFTLYLGSSENPVICK